MTSAFFSISITANDSSALSEVKTEEEEEATSVDFGFSLPPPS